MRIDIDFIGDSADSISAIKTLEVSIKGLTVVVDELARALKDIQIPNQAVSIAKGKTLEGELKAIQREAKQAARDVAAVKLAHSGLPTIKGLGATPGFAAGPGRPSASQNASWSDLAKLMAYGQTWRQAANRRPMGGSGAYGRYISMFGGSNAGVPTQYGPKSFPFITEKEGVKDGDAYMRGFGRAVRGGGGGRGGRRGHGFFEGGYRSSLFGESLTSIVPGGGRARGPALALGAGLGATAAAPLLPGLTGLLAAIPAAASAAAGALATLALAFHDVGAAVGGNKKAFDQLVPAQKEFVQVMRNDMIPLLNGARQVAAKGLFPGLTEALKQIAGSKQTMTVFGDALHSMGVALGNVAKMFSTYLTSNGFLEQFGQLTKGLRPVVEVFGKSLVVWLDVFVRLAVAFQPLLLWLGQMSLKLAKMADHWAEAKQAGEGFGGTIKGMEDSLVLSVRLVAALTRFFKELVLALIPAGQTLDTGVVGGLERMATWLHKNHVAVQDFTTHAIKALGEGFGFLVEMFGAFVDVARTVHGVLERVTGITLDTRNAFRLLFALLIAKNFFNIAKSVAGVAVALNTKLIPALVGTEAAASTALTTTAKLKLALMGIAKLAAAGLIVAITVEIYEKLIPDFKGKHYSGIDLARDIGDKIFGVGGGPGPKKPKGHGTGAGPTGERAGGSGGGGPGGGTGGSSPEAGATSGRTVRWSGAHGGLKGSFKSKLAMMVAAIGGTSIYVSSGKRSDASHPGGPVNTGARNSNHLTGSAADGTAVIKGRTYQLGNMPVSNGVYAKYGLRAGRTFTWGGSPDYMHVDDGTNVGGISANTIVPTGSAAPWTNTGDTSTPAVATREQRLGAIAAIDRAQAAAKGVRAQLGRLSPHQVTHTIDNVTISAVVGLPLSKQDAALKKQIAQWEKQLAADEAFLRKHKHLSSKELAEIKRRDARLAKAIADGKARIAKEIEARKDKFLEKWAELTDQFLAAFDDETDRLLEAFDEKAQKFKTPTEAIIEAMSEERTKRDLQRAVDDAQKNLDEALAGLSGDTAQATLDRITEVIGRYSLAVAVDKAQAAILGGGTGNFTDQMLKELQNAATSGASGGVDPEAVKRAQEDLQDALNDQYIHNYLEPRAVLEREAQDKKDAADRKALEKNRTTLRTELEKTLAVWGDYWAKAGASAGQAYSIFDAIVFNLTGKHLPPLVHPATAGALGGGAPITSLSGFQNATNPTFAMNTPNPGAAGATAVAGATGVTTSSGGVSGPVVSTTVRGGANTFWNVNQSGTFDAINSAASSGGSVTITEQDAFTAAGQQMAIDANLRNVPYSIQINADANDTPESLAAKVAAAKALYPGAQSITLDLESPNVRGGPGSPGWAWNQRAASLSQQAAGGTPLVITTEGVSDFNYGAWNTGSNTFAPQAFTGDMKPRNVWDIVQMLLAQNVPIEKIVPLIGPNQQTDYPLPVGVFGATRSGGSGSLSTPQLQSVYSTLANIEGSSISPTLPILQAVVAAATTTEAPLQSYYGGGGIRMMADGGILTRPTLMVGGEKGREAVIPLSSARGKSMLGHRADDPIQVQINVGEGMEWLSEFISVEAVRNAKTVGLVQGKDADRRGRERRT